MTRTIEPLYTLAQLAELASRRLHRPIPLVTLRRHFDRGILPEPKHRTGEKQITRRFTEREAERVVEALRDLGDRRSVVRAIEREQRKRGA